MLVRKHKKSKAEIIRTALNKGLNIWNTEHNSGAEVLLRLVELGKKHNVKGPRDASVNHDFYLWGLPKKNPRLKP